MKHLILSTCLMMLPLSNATATDDAKTLASTLEVFVFPTEGQVADQQSMDEAECYEWAVGNTGSDPFELQKQSEQQHQQAEQQAAEAQNATKGSGAKGAVRGAAAGAVIGEVSGGDAGDSAAIGAAAVGVAARRRARAASEQAQEQIHAQDAAQQQSTQEQIENFKNGFSVCLEAKEYMVKF